MPIDLVIEDREGGMNGGKPGLGDNLTDSRSETVSRNSWKGVGLGLGFPLA